MRRGVWNEKGREKIMRVRDSRRGRARKGGGKRDKKNE